MMANLAPAPVMLPPITDYGMLPATLGIKVSRFILRPFRRRSYFRRSCAKVQRRVGCPSFSPRARIHRIACWNEKFSSLDYLKKRRSGLFLGPRIVDHCEFASGAISVANVDSDRRASLRFPFLAMIKDEF